MTSVVPCCRLNAASGLLVNRRGVLGLVTGALAQWREPALADTELPAQASMMVHSADADGFYANSYLFEGNNSWVLIDAQLTSADANRIVDLVKASGKPLESIIITHIHPDHYFGLETIGSAFPRAIIYSAEPSIREIAATALYWPEFKNPLVPIAAGPCTFSGINFECLVMPDAESIAPLVLYLPEERTLIAGDHCLHNQHLWLAEGRLDAWLENLRTLRDRWPVETILPGHGSLGGIEILEATQNYLYRFREAVRSGNSIADVKKSLLDAQPELRFETALDVSLSAFLRK